MIGLVLICNVFCWVVATGLCEWLGRRFFVEVLDVLLCMGSGRFYWRIGWMDRLFLGGGRFAGLDRLWVGRSILGGSPHSLGA